MDILAPFKLTFSYYSPNLTLHLKVSPSHMGYLYLLIDLFALYSSLVSSMSLFLDYVLSVLLYLLKFLLRDFSFYGTSTGTCFLGGDFRGFGFGLEAIFQGLGAPFKTALIATLWVLGGQDFPLVGVSSFALSLCCVPWG